MRDKRHWRILLVGALALTFSVAGCGDDDDDVALECTGEGVEVQEQEDGALLCVAKTHDCGDDEIVTPLGQCQPVDIFCGDGTEVDSSSGECVSTSNVECGAGTIPEDGRCVLEDPLFCGPGTVLADEVCEVSEDACGPGSRFDGAYCEVDPDEACDGRAELDVVTGECVDEGVVECGDNTVEVDNLCMPMGTVADDLAADADVQQGDSATINIDEDDPVVFAGALDSALDYSFNVNGEAGQWVEITLYSRGLPSPAFSLTHSEWERSTIAGMSSQPKRTVLIPETGSYDLTISTSSTAAAGHPDWAYVGTVEVVDSPDAYQWDIFEDALEGDLVLTTNNWIRADVDTGVDEVMVAVQDYGSNAHGPTMEVWGSPSARWSQNALDDDDQISVPTQGEETLWFHFDAVQFDGPDTNFAVSAQETSILPPGATFDTEIDVDAGDIFVASHQSNEDAPMDVTISFDGEEIVELGEVPAERISYDADETPRPHVLAEDSGTYTITYTNNGSDEVTGFISSASVEDAPRFEVDAEGISNFNHSFDGDEYDTGDWQYVVIEAAEMANHEVDVDANDGEVDLALYDADRFAVASEEASGSMTQLEALSTEEQIFVLAIKPTDEITEGIDVQIRAEVFQSIGPDEVVSETFDLDTNDVLRGTVSPFTGDELNIQLINPNGVVLLDVEEVDGPYDIAEVIAGPGEYTLEVTNPSFTPSLIGDINVAGYEPFDILDVTEPPMETYDRPALSAGEREVMLVRYLSDDMVGAELMLGDDDDMATLRSWEPSNPVPSAAISTPDELLIGLGGEQNEVRIVEVEAGNDFSSDYELEVRELLQLEVSESVEPDLHIPDGDDFEHVLTVPSCPNVLEIDMDIDLDFIFATVWLTLRLEAPDGTEITLWSEGGTQDSDGGEIVSGTDGFIFGNFNKNLDPDGTDAVPIMDLEGVNGSGEWTLYGDNRSSFRGGNLNSWGLNLLCEF